MEKPEMYLEDLEERICDEEEQRIYQAWTDFAEGNSTQAPFRGICRAPKPSRIQWPDININDALENQDLMLIRELKACSDQLAKGSERLMQIRANYGVGILPTVLGAEIFIMPYHTDTLPNVHPLAEPEEAVKRLLDQACPVFENGWGSQVFSMAQRFQKIRKTYPKIAKWIRVDHPDCQGPMDLCELLWGSGLFLQLYDQEKLVHAFLQKLTGFYLAFLDRWFSLVPNPDRYHAYAGRLHKGAVCVRNDSAMNLSPAMYAEFIFPYDQQIFRHYQGGAIHFCGRGDHFISQMAQTAYLYAIDLSQPHLNDMELVVSQTVDKGINLHTVPGAFYEKLGTGHQLHRLLI